jgi:hypothetical protein
VVGLVISPRDAQQISAATQAGAIFTSDDGGQSWQHQPVPTSQALTALALDPQRPDTLALGTAGDGIYLSTDGGASWAPAGVAGPTVTSLTFSPGAPDVAFAATADAGLYQSIDGGQSWQQDTNGLSTGSSFSAVVVDPHAPARVVAGTDQGEIFRSTNGGTIWSQAASPASSRVYALLFDPASHDNLLAGTDSGICSSPDGGQTWEAKAIVVSANGQVLTLVMGPVLTLAAGARGALPSDSVPAPVPARPGLQYFPATHHTLAGAFRTFYTRYGGLKVFGLPLTEPFTEAGARVQYFERARMVVLPGGRVGLGALGRLFTAGRAFLPVAPFADTPSQRYFPATGHSLGGRFLTFWRTHHGSLVLGPPISEPLREQNGDGTGRAYLLQYFVNGRLEDHPELTGTGFQVQIGLLGRLLLRQRGWLEE